MPFEEVAAFHGHICPGLAIGYRMALAGLAALDAARAEDEDLVAIVENDACGVDAVQMLSGCTFGKGNLLFKDHGKPVYSFVSRRTGLGVRVAWRADAVPASREEDRESRVAWILGAPREEIVEVRALRIDPPARAEIRPSVVCDRCGERVMDTRVISQRDARFCIPCWEESDENLS